ncbi:MAG: ATP-binding cassette domain-containing protein, partial [Clostridia bacterium]
MTALLEAVNICRNFKQGSQIVHALVDVNITIEPGTLTMLAGRSGSGKTTLMNIAGALDRPSSGTIFFHDREISSLSDNKRDEIRRKNMGFVFQSV